MLRFRALHGEKARLIAERNYFKVKCNGRKTKANERKRNGQNIEATGNIAIENYIIFYQ